MPLLLLRADVHAAIVDDDLVLLDVAADRYVCLAGAGRCATLSGGRERLETRDAEVCDRLLEGGLLQDGETLATARTPLPPNPGRSGLLSDIPPTEFRDLAPAAAALLDLALHYRQRAFAEIIEAGLRPRQEPPRLTEALQTAALRFHAWVPYAPVSGQCLLRSFMLLRLLRRQGLDALWVFGVQTWPFHAHCWLQVEDMVLDDPAERVSTYTPIMVV